MKAMNSWLALLSQVRPSTAAERSAYQLADFDVEQFKSDIGVSGSLLYKSKEKILEHRWAQPTLSLHGIKGAFDEPNGIKTVIPHRVTGRFSLRLVPDMQVERIDELVQTHLQKKFGALGSSNVLKIDMLASCPPWYRASDSAPFAAASQATLRIHGVPPCMTREGGSIPVVPLLEEYTSSACVLLPIGASDDCAHSQNEKLDKRNYIQGTRTVASFMHEVGKLQRKQQTTTDILDQRSKKKHKFGALSFLMGCDCLECRPVPTAAL